MITEKQALKYLKQQWTNYKVLIQPIESSIGKGIPDLYIWTGGYGWWIELKSENRPLRPVQRNWIRRASLLGVPAGIVRVWPDYNFTFELGLIEMSDPMDYNATTLYQRLYAGV